MRASPRPFKDRSGVAPPGRPGPLRVMQRGRAVSPRRAWGKAGRGLRQVGPLPAALALLVVGPAVRERAGRGGAPGTERVKPWSWEARGLDGGCKANPKAVNGAGWRDAVQVPQAGAWGPGPQRVVQPTSFLCVSAALGPAFNPLRGWAHVTKSFVLVAEETQNRSSLFCPLCSSPHTARPHSSLQFPVGPLPAGPHLCVPHNRAFQLQCTQCGQLPGPWHPDCG